MVNSAFRDDVIAGLLTAPKAIPARWFYDHRGSQLFEAITELEEYHPTRVEREILAKAASQIATLVGPGTALVELGSGSSAKTPVVIESISAAAYVPIDISGDFLRESVEALADGCPGLPIYPVVADSMEPLQLPAAIAGKPRLGFFPGSTIGNLSPVSAVDLLRRLAGALGVGARLLIGIDCVKGEEALVRAYDDQKGVTASFNLNLLDRINRELAGTIPIDAFSHQARWNAPLSRIEMHLAASRDVIFEVAGERFALKASETIHT